MFFSKHPVQTLHLYTENGEELLSCPLKDYSLPEAVIVEMSIAYYSDPEPCEIHRGAVTKRALLEISDLCAGSQTVPVRSLEKRQQVWFPDNAAFVAVTETGR